MTRFATYILLVLLSVLALGCGRNQAEIDAAKPILVFGRPRPDPLPPPRIDAPLFHVRSGSFDLQISSPDPQIVHLVVTPSGYAGEREANPFVVLPETARGLAGRINGVVSTYKLPAATLLARSSGFVIEDAHARQILSGISFHEALGGVAFALQHKRGDRFYGGGNSLRSQSGGLIKFTGKSMVDNGVTQIPFIWSSGGYGILVANDRQGVEWRDDKGTMSWKTPSSFVDMYIIVADSPYGLLNAYSRLTGRAPIPPRWSLGYLQSRWGYASAADVRDKWQRFRKAKIPIDGFIYDYDWFHNDWEFDPKSFPNPRQDIADMSGMGLRFIGIRKPRMHKMNLALPEKNGWVFCGSDLRFDLPEARAWWWTKQEPLYRQGVAGWWNDEAEHDYDEFFHMAQTEWEGGRAAGSRRVWSLNRAFSPGMQRFGAAVWTGDIDSSWESLRQQPGTLLNYSLCGMPFVGQDIGGFSGMPSPELFVRWIQEGVFVPVMRAHGGLNSDRWPWAFGPKAEAAVKKAIDLRYRLLPYLYGEAEESSRTGSPWMRPLFFEFPTDKRVWAMDDEWLVGQSILAAPVLAPGGRRSVYLPRGRWYELSTGRPVEGGKSITISARLDEIPAYVRAGSILPIGPVVQYSAQKSPEPLEIRVYPGADGSYSLYEDNGETYGYEQGERVRTLFRWNDRSRTLTIGPRDGAYPGMLARRTFRVRVAGNGEVDVDYDGKAMTVRLFP